MNGLYNVNAEGEEDEEDLEEEEDVETTDEVLEGIQKIIQKSCPRQKQHQHTGIRGVGGPKLYRRKTEKSTTILLGVILVFVFCHVLRLRLVPQDP